MKKIIISLFIALFSITLTGCYVATDPYPYTTKPVVAQSSASNTTIVHVTTPPQQDRGRYQRPPQRPGIPSNAPGMGKPAGPHPILPGRGMPGAPQNPTIMPVPGNAPGMGMPSAPQQPVAMPTVPSNAPEMGMPAAPQQPAAMPAPSEPAAEASVSSESSEG